MIPGIKKRVVNLHDVMMYIAIFRKHLRLMTLLMCFVALAGLNYYIYARPVYFSRALVEVDFLKLPLDSSTIHRDGRLGRVRQQLRAPHLIERTARRLGIEGNARKIQERHIKKSVIRVNSERNIEIDIWPYRHELAKKWAETLIDEFTKMREEQRAEHRETIIAAFTDEMRQVAEKMDLRLGAKFEFKDEKQLASVLIQLSRVKEIPRQLIRINKQLDAMSRTKIQLQDPSLDTVAKLSLLSTVESSAAVSVGEVIGGQTEPGHGGDAQGAPQNPGVVVVPSMIMQERPWEVYDKEKRRIEAEIARAAEIYLPGHKTMIALEKRLNNAERALELDLDTARTRFDLEFENLLSMQRDLETRLPELQKVSKRHEQIQQEAALFDAGQLAWKNLYAKMAKEIELLDFTENKERVNLQYLGILEMRDVDRPVSPNRMRLLMMSLLFGGLLALGVPFVIEYMDHTVTNFEEVEATFRMRGLGIIPKVDGGETERTALLSSDEREQRNLLENFRVIRTNLLSMGMLSKAPHVMMVTSAMPKEGKTVISANLGISFAQMGAKTVIIDTDLRRGRLHRMFGFRKAPGLSSLLLGSSSVDEVCRPTGRENLSVISAGEHVESGTELLGSANFAAIMAELRQRFDRIIIDTPPVLGLSETSILQNHVDGVLFVVWSGRTPLRNMRTAVDILQSNGANFYGFILNRLDLSATTNYYQYYYYSNDYYHNYHALENAQEC